MFSICDGLRRDNAALTRKRQRIYAEFLDKAIDGLTELLAAERESVADLPVESPLDAKDTRKMASKKATSKKTSSI